MPCSKSPQQGYYIPFIFRRDVQVNSTRDKNALIKNSSLWQHLKALYCVSYTRQMFHKKGGKLLQIKCVQSGNLKKQKWNVDVKLNFPPPSSLITNICIGKTFYF